MRFGNKKGFTLLELIIVITVLALLVTMVLMRYQNVSEQARYSQVASNLVKLRSAIARYQMANSKFPLLASLEVFQTMEVLDTSADGYSNLGDHIEGIPRTPRFLSTADGQIYPATNEVTDVAGGNTDGGWLYDEATGVINPDLPATQFGATNWDTQNSNF